MDFYYIYMKLNQAFDWLIRQIDAYLESLETCMQEYNFNFG